MDETRLLPEQQIEWSSENVAQSVSTEKTCPTPTHEKESKETNVTIPGNIATPKIKKKLQLVTKKYQTNQTDSYITNRKQIISIYETFMTTTLERHGKKMTCEKGSEGYPEMLVNQMEVLMHWFSSKIEHWKCKYEEKEKYDRLNEERMEKMIEKCKPNIEIYENCFNKQSGVYNVMDFRKTQHTESNVQFTDAQPQDSCSHETFNQPQWSEDSNIAIMQTTENQSSESITSSEYPMECDWKMFSECHSTESESNASLENRSTEYETIEYVSDPKSLTDIAKATAIQQHSENTFDENSSQTTEEQKYEDIDVHAYSYVERCLNCIDALNETLNLRNAEMLSLKRLNETLNQRNTDMSSLNGLYKKLMQEIEPKVDELLEITKSKPKTFTSSSKRKRREKLLFELKRWIQSLLLRMEDDTNRSELVEIVKEAVASIRVREDFHPLNRSSLPEDAKPLHMWISVKYRHKPQLLQKLLHGPSEECFEPNESEKWDIYAMFLVTWVKNNEDNTPEQLMEIFSQLDDSLAAGDETLPREEENPSQNA